MFTRFTFRCNYCFFNIIAIMNFNRSFFKSGAMFLGRIKCSNRLSTVAREIARRPFRRLIIRQRFTYIGSALWRGITFFRLIMRRYMILQRVRVNRTHTFRSLYSSSVYSNRRPAASTLLLINGTQAFRLVTRPNIKD